MLIYVLSLSNAKQKTTLVGFNRYTTIVLPCHTIYIELDAKL